MYSNASRYSLLAYCFISLLVTCVSLKAQPPAIFFDHITTRDGLSNNSVNAIMKDRQGFLWVGTSDGLNRYDGKNFITYYHSIYEKNSLPHNDVYCVFEDDRGYIWIATFNGLCRLNPSIGEIRQMQLPGQSDKNSFLIVSDVKQDKKGAVWVATNKGLFWVNQKKDELVPTDLPAQFLTKLLLIDADTLLIATYDGITKYNTSNGGYVNYQVPSSTDVRQTLVKCLYMDRRGRVWLGTWGRGLQCFDPASKTFTRFLPREDLGERGDANIIYNITQTGYAGEDNILWVTADALGLLAFNMETGKFTGYSSSDEDSRNGVFGHGYSFCMAKDEGLWIGGSNGLYRYDPHHQLFRHVVLPVDPGRHCLKEVLSAYADPLDSSGKTLLVGTWTCGSYRVDLANGSMQPLPVWIAQQVGESHITSFLRDKEKTLWLGTSNSGLLRVNEVNKTIAAFYPPVTGESRNPRNVQLVKDAGNGKLWLGTIHGLFLFDKQTSNLVTVFRKGVNAPADVSHEVRAMTFDRDNNLWLCTNLRHNDKPVVVKLSAGSLQPVLYYPDTSPLQGITCDKTNNIWCASWNGVVYWNASEKNPVYKRLTRKDGLSNDKVFKVLADRQGYIWMATLRGVSCYDPQGKAFRNYFTTEGLYQDNIGNFFRNEITGEMLAGYDGSIDIVDPVHALRKRPPPGIVITGVKVFNEVHRDNKKSYFHKGLVELAPEQNMVTISYSALWFTDPYAIRYAYKMEGVDQDWIYTANDFVTYHNLPAGSRKFFVKARNAEGVWSTEDAWLGIDIAPPFYRRWWFIALVVMAIAAAIYFLYRARIRRLEEKFHMRSVIARDLHDEIGSTLTSINILSRVSQSNLEKDKAKAAGLLQKITEQSQDMQQSMSDIIWAIKPDNDKLENMAARMREYLSHTLEAKDIAIRFEADEQVLKESLSMEQRRDFFLIFKEAVNNAAKYSASSAVGISLRKHHHHILLAVSDEGIGFDVTKKTTTNGLKNMQARAAALNAVLTITSAPGKGTTIELNIPTT